MLPNNRPELSEHLERYIEIELANESKHYCLNRTYHMSYIPAGFWSRLIGTLKTCSSMSFSSTKALSDILKEEKISDIRIILDFKSGSLLSSFYTARLMIAVQKWGMQVSDGTNETSSESENYEHKVWREGVLVTYDDGFYLVESFHDEVCI